MSAASPILICPVVQLHTLPDMDRDVLRRFFTEHVRGMDPANDKRWRRFARDLFNAAPGEGFELQRQEARGGPYHRMHRAFLTRLFLSQERYATQKTLHNWLKYGADFVEPVEGREPGTVWWRPRSTAFAVCSEDEMREFHTAAVEFLHGERAQRFLWRHVRAKDRPEMLDAVLKDREEDTP